MKIFGHELRIFKTPTAQIDTELGETGTTIFSGFISDEDYISELTGSSAISTYDKMRKSDGVVKASLLACELPIRAANWYIQPASEDEGDKQVAEFVKQCLFEKMTITWDDFLRQALLMLPFGFSVFEKVFAMIDFEGKQMVGWKKFSPRKQETILKWATETNEDGITQMPPSGGTISIPIEKLLVFTHQKEGDNWVGISILRNAYRSWYYKTKIENINAISFERQGLGIPVGHLPKSFTKKDRDKLEKLLKNVRANEQSYMILPDGWSVEFIDMKASTIKDPTQTIQRLNREILISVLAHFMDLGSGPYGSRALSADQSTTFHNNLTAVARHIKDTINKYAIKQLVDLNFTVARYPTLEFSKIGMIEYEKLSRALSSLIQQGAITPDEKMEKYLRQTMDLPENEEPQTKEKPPVEKPKPEEKKTASEFIGWRPLTFAEKKVNFLGIQRKMDNMEKELKASIEAITRKIVNDLILQFQIVFEAPDNYERREKLKNIHVRYQDEYKEKVFNFLKEGFEFGKSSVLSEIKKGTFQTPSDVFESLKASADNLTENMANDLIKAGKTSVLTSIQQKMSFVESEMLRRLMASIKSEAGRIAFSVPAIVIGTSINQGRRMAMTYYDEGIYGIQRSEILDAVTCNFCMSIDKRVFKKSDSFIHNDIIHSNCRGIWVEIMAEETEKPDLDGIPQSLRDSFETINVFKLPRNPIIKKDSPAATFLRSQKKLAEQEKMDNLIEINQKIKDILADE